MYTYLYKITNNINNKEYVGIHTTANIGDNYMGAGVLIEQAIKKYGIENFTKEIIEIFDNREDALRAEQLLVTEQYVLLENTYNIVVGGNVPPMRRGKRASESTLAKLKKYRQTVDGKKIFF